MRLATSTGRAPAPEAKNRAHRNPLRSPARHLRQDSPGDMRMQFVAGQRRHRPALLHCRTVTQGDRSSDMKASKILGRGAKTAALLALLAAPAVRADGGMIAGGTIGGQLYKAGSDNLFVKYIGKQAMYVNDLYFYLTVGGVSLIK